MDADIFKSLHPGDVLHYEEKTGSKKRKFDFTVLRKNVDDDAVYLSRANVDSSFPVAYPYNPWWWNHGKNTMVDNQGGTFPEEFKFAGISRGKSSDVVEIYEQVPRQESVRFHIDLSDPKTREMLGNDPAMDIIVKILANNEVGHLHEILSLALDSLKIEHDERKLAILTITVYQLIKIFNENTGARFVIASAIKTSADETPIRSTPTFPNKKTLH